MFLKPKSNSSSVPPQDLTALADIFVRQCGVFAAASKYITVTPRCIASSAEQLSRHIFKNDLPMVLTGSEFIPFHYASHNYSRLTQEELAEFASLLNARLENRFAVSPISDPDQDDRIQAYSFRNTNVAVNPYKMWK